VVQLDSTLHTPRLDLRRFTLDDLDDLALLFEREDVTRYLYYPVRDRDETLEVLKSRLAKPEGVSDSEKNVLSFAVHERAGGRLVGDFMLAWDVNEHHQAEMGGSLHPDVHGRGYATEIYGALLELAFTRFDRRRVVGRCDARNVASVRSLEKAGLHQEAHLIENEFVKGEWTDEIILAIRRSEWEHQRAGRTSHLDA
jgi:RimJ/RimL family protein N-acetyltransferase